MSSVVPLLASELFGQEWPMYLGPIRILPSAVSCKAMVAATIHPAGAIWELVSFGDVTYVRQRMEEGEKNEV